MLSQLSTNVSTPEKANCPQSWSMLPKSMKKSSPSSAYLRVLAALAQQDVHNIFRFPLVVDELPKYTTLVKNPLDFSTIAACVNAKLYENDSQFESDVVDVFLNCCMYNKVGSTLFETACSLLSSLAQIFEREGLKGQRLFITKSLPTTELTHQLFEQAIMLRVMQDVQSRVPHHLANVSVVSFSFPLSLRHVHERVLGHVYPSISSFAADVDASLAFIIASLREKEEPIVMLRAELHSFLDKAVDYVTNSVFRNGLEISKEALWSGKRNPWTELSPHPSMPLELRSQLMAMILAFEALDSQFLFAYPILDSGYVKNVRYPMDLLTVKLKLFRGLYFVDYATPQPSLIVDLVKADIELIVDNCIATNGPEHPFSKEICRMRAELPALLMEHKLA